MTAIFKDGSNHTWLGSILLGALLVTIALMHMVTNSLASSPAILDVIPTEAPNSFDATLVITGNGFVPDPAPIVRLGDHQLTLSGTVTNQVVTAVVPWGLEVGIYDLTVENDDGDIVTRTAAFTVTAGLGVWSTSGPYGGAISQLAVDEFVSSTVYGNLDMIGLVKTDDSGLRWRTLFPGYVSTFALKPGDPQTIYLSADSDWRHWLLRSSDAGQVWETLFEGRPWALGVTPADPLLVYAGFDNWHPGEPISRSLDGGDSWQAAANGLPDDASIGIMAVHPATASIAYAGLDSGQVYKTVNGGGTWILTGGDFGETWWSTLVIDQHNPQRLYASGWHGAEFFARSSDGGDTWQDVDLPPDYSRPSDITVHPTVSGTVYALAGGILVSTDAGITWDPLGENGLESWALGLDPLTGVPIYLGHSGKGLLHSDDGGLSWEVRREGLAGIIPYDVASSPADPRYVYVASESGAFASNNGGKSWLEAESGGEIPMGISVHPQVPTVAYLGGRFTVYKTEDGGQHWQGVELPGLEGPGDRRINTLAIDPGDPRVVYAGAGMWDMTGGPEVGWLYRSVDDGLTWKPVTVTVPISAVTDIAVDPTDSATIYVATGRRWVDSHDRGSGLVKSTDGGDSWAYINEGITALNITRLAIVPDNPQLLYAGSNLSSFQEQGGVFKTEDGGVSWQKSRDWFRISGLQVDPLVTDTVYAGNYWGGLWHTTDAGDTWERVKGPLGQLSSHCIAAVGTLSRTVVYAGVAGGVVAPAAAQTAGLSLAVSEGGEFYGGGVYQITVDRRPQPFIVFLPLVLKGTSQ